MSLCAKWCTL